MSLRNSSFTPLLSVKVLFSSSSSVEISSWGVSAVSQRVINLLMEVSSFLNKPFSPDSSSIFSPGFYLDARRNQNCKPGL